MITIYTLVYSICFTNEVYSQTLSVKTGFSLTLDDLFFQSSPCSYLCRLVSITKLMHILFVIYIYIYIYYIIILDIFRAIQCSSSGGQIVLLQHLVSSLYSLHRLRADCNPLLTGTLNRVTIPDAVTIQFHLLNTSMVFLETCRGL